LVVIDAAAKSRHQEALSEVEMVVDEGFAAEDQPAAPSEGGHDHAAEAADEAAEAIPRHCGPPEVGIKELR
jgi:hypothetical protein